MSERASTPRAEGVTESNAAARNSILFEPWHLGDALIAFSIALQAPERLAVSCNARWHRLLRFAADDLPCPPLLEADVSYIASNRMLPDREKIKSVRALAADVLSIRGDIRDYRTACQLYPQARMHFIGWMSFLARRSAILDLPFGEGWCPVRNRYRAWADIASVPWAKVVSFYKDKPAHSGPPSIAIHVGARWRAKQFPDVAGLKDALSDLASVEILAGPGDVLPAGVAERDVRRVVDHELVAALRANACVLANDSGPMHLAALLRRPTVVLSHVSPMPEWLPPEVVSIASESAPIGYRPRPSYQSDAIVPGWPSVVSIVPRVRELLSTACDNGNPRGQA